MFFLQFIGIYLVVICGSNFNDGFKLNSQFGGKAGSKYGFYSSKDLLKDSASDSGGVEVKAAPISRVENFLKKVRTPPIATLPAEEGKDENGKKIVKAPRARKKEDYKEPGHTQYRYHDGVRYFSEPFIDEPMWYRLNVRKASEMTLRNYFVQQPDNEENEWYGVVFDSYVPRQAYVAFKGKKDNKRLDVSYKAMVPGLVFVKCIMTPEITKDLEDIKSVRMIMRNMYGLVEPLDEEDQAECLKFQKDLFLNNEAQKLQLGEYCSIIGGPHVGKYGIIEGAALGRITVRVRSEYKDYHANIDFDDLTYLADPPEVNYKEMTPKQAVESLMVKNPHSDMLKSLKKEGLLDEILYPEGKPYEERDSRRDFNRDGDRERDSRQGREGGRTQRSIAKDSPESKQREWKQRDPDDKPNKSWVPKDRPVNSASPTPASYDSTWGGSERDSNMGSSGSSRSSWKTGAAMGADDGMESMFTRASSSSSDSRSSSSSSRSSSSSKKGGSDDDFDSFIEQMLQEVEEPARSSSRGSDDDDNLSLDWVTGEGDTNTNTFTSTQASGALTGAFESSEGSNRDRKDSEQVLDDLLRELRLGGAGETKPKKEKRPQSIPWATSTPKTRGEERVDMAGSDEQDDTDDFDTADWKRSATKATPMDYDLEALFDDSSESSPMPRDSNDDDAPSNSASTSPEGTQRTERKSLLKTARARTGLPNEPKPQEAGQGPRAGGGAPPDVDSFESFEDYLNALVETQSQGPSWQSKKISRTNVDTTRVAPSAVSSITTTSAASPEPVMKPVTTAATATSSGSSGSDSGSSGSDSGSSGSDLSSLSVKDLKLRLKAAGLKQTGVKADMIERLNA